MTTTALVSVQMKREDLTGIPQFAVPEPFAVRCYRPGDAETWVRIQTEADRYHTVSRGLFDEQFGRDERALAERQLYLCDGQGEAIGTATAWFDPGRPGLAWGRLHWVAIVPTMQGRGLAKPLLGAACDRLRELGHARAFLRTETVRVPAIRLYLRFGFVPDIRHAADVTAWRELQHNGLRVDLPGEPCDRDARPA